MCNSFCRKDLRRDSRKCPRITNRYARNPLRHSNRRVRSARSTSRSRPTRSPRSCRQFGRHGDAFRAHSPALKRDLWVLSHPDHVRHVLVDHHANFTKGIGIERVAILLGNGLMTSEGEQWRTQRKMVQPSFHRKVIATWMPHIHAATRAARRALGQAAAAACEPSTSRRT